MSDQLRLSAYYYSFEPTGVREIDLILCAVAWAGKAYHHTDSWQEDTGEYPNCVGKTPIEWIQNAAIGAARELAAAKETIEGLRKEKDQLWRNSYYCTEDGVYHTVSDYLDNEQPAVGDEFELAECAQLRVVKFKCIEDEGGIDYVEVAAIAEKHK